MINIKKQKLFVDVDSTIIDTISGFCSHYNKYYSWIPGFTVANPSKVERWDLTCECTLLDSDDANLLFRHRALWDHMKFMPNAYEVLDILQDRYEIILVTIGHNENIAYKSLWLNKNLPFVENSIFISNAGIKMDKSIVDMSGGIFIDDHESNLLSSNADRKILFGKRYTWNENWKGEHANTWDDILNRL